MILMTSRVLPLTFVQNVLFSTLLPLYFHVPTHHGHNSSFMQGALALRKLRTSQRGWVKDSSCVSSTFQLVAIEF